MVLAVALAAVAALALMTGPGGLGLPAVTGDARAVILIDVRLPRVLIGIVTGLALGASGAALQGYVRNPLAEPGLLGVTGGAALGAVVAIHCGLTALAPMALPLAGLLGAGLATLALLALAGRDPGPTRILLAGVAVSSLTAAAISMVLMLAANPFAQSEMVYWMMGSLEDRSLDHVALVAVPVAAGLVLLLSTRAGLDALSLGDAAATSLGVDLRSLARRIIAGTALMAGAATAVTGSIGFVGLVVPHLLRAACGHRPGALILPSALGGAILVVLADTLTRLAAPGADVRLGVVTALIGAPVLLRMVLASNTVGSGRGP